MAYVVCAKWTAKEGKEDRLAEVIEEMTEPSRAEPGNRYYQAHRSPENPRLYFLYEQYDDEAGYEAHMASEHFTRLVKEEAIPDAPRGPRAGVLRDAMKLENEFTVPAADRARVGGAARRRARRAVPARRDDRGRRGRRVRRAR